MWDCRSEDDGAVAFPPAQLVRPSSGARARLKREEPVKRWQDLCCLRMARAVRDAAKAYDSSRRGGTGNRQGPAGPGGAGSYAGPARVA
eukprot:4125176-Alexandrium_andersonii.AAC.1